MTDRASKRMRRRSTEYEESEGTDEWMNGNSVAVTASSTRPRRGTANQSPAAAVIQRSSPEETRQSIHLTVKSSPGKLRQATSGIIPKGRVSKQNIVVGKRASRSSRIVREVDSEEDEDEDEAEEADVMDVDDDDDEENDVDAEGDDDEDMDAEGDEDDDMDDDTPAPNIIVSTKQHIPVKPIINVTKAKDSVEAKEMAMDDDDDEELSELDSELDDEDAEGEDEDAEGEEDDEMGEHNGEDEEMDSDEDISRGQTPDVSKMTKRQRALVEEGSDGGLMALSNEAQKKKHLTAEENAMRRAEMARRRKNLSEKRNEEEKMDTINRLLKKQPPKRGRRTLDVTEFGQEEDADVEKANPLFVRYIQNAKGSQLGVPDEWLQAPVGKFFAGELAPKNQRPFSGRMVEEVA
ncbi:PAPA-1-like conserved region-domain-containing protein [Phaeosphaeriaceae sp. PMI808]|nr:PAPA-1-like conserved region-domain-containing protein [Phaeosphaeriaceae sp. PMI808]